MCYAIPAKIIKITGDTALVDYSGVTKTVNISLMDDIAVGDYVLIHAGFAIEKLVKESAEEALEIIKRDIAQFDEEDLTRPEIKFG
jgi:hydrogenase expression/formation protein HypC